MESALSGIANSQKHSATKEAVAQAREALKNQDERGDVPIAYLREKCLAAIELAFDHGNEKCSHSGVEGVQALLRDQRFHSVSIEKPDHNLPTQILHSMTGIEQWNQQLQCHCLTLLVEMICSSELKVSLAEVEETLELCMRVYGGSREESVRVSARAAVSQSITSYFGNRYGSADEAQEQIAVFFDSTKLLESYVTKLDQLSTSNDQSVVVFDATNALLASQSLSVQKHTPFVNLLWEKLCPLMIRLLGVPDKNVTSSSITISSEEPVGQGQINKFPLSPAVISNPEATRALYSILEQLIRIMAAIPSVSSVLEALFHKAFLFPKIEQRTEAVRVIRKIVSSPKRIADLVAAATRTKSLSLWRMLIVCLLESANPNYEIAIDAVRSCGAMLQGVLDFSRSTQLLDSESRRILGEMFTSLHDVTVTSFTAKSDVGTCSPRPSTDTQPASVTTETEEDVDDEMSQTLKRLTAKFGMERQSEGSVPRPILQRRNTEYDETSEKVTAQKFVDALSDKLSDWMALRSTLAVDEAILEFSANFYSDFSAVHNEVFKAKSKVQQEFLNTDAIYLTAYAALSLYLRGPEKFNAAKFKESVLTSGCIIYVSDSWLQKVYDHLVSDCQKEGITGSLKDVIYDYDGLDRKLLSDWQRLNRISRGSQSDLHPYEERLAARWFITSAWDSIVHILSTFLGVKDRRRARPKVIQGAEHAINGIQKLATVALELELGDRCAWIFANLVEASCDVEELRATATTEEQKRWTIVTRLDLLSIQMILDNAFVGVHAPECWKHVIRCTEFVWELEKYIYGALCYEKPARFSFGKKKVETVENKAEEGLSCADRSVEVAIGDRELDRDNMNKALAVLIAKVDRFYSECGRKLCLRSLRELSVSLVGASENRILYSNQKAPALAPAVNLLSRISEVITPLPNRPLIHQMLIWPIVGAHFIQIAPCGDESRSAVDALSEAAASMLVSESNGMCFNQMLFSPFQAIVCSDICSSETREQLVSTLSEYVKERFDTLGSGWKPLFGTLKAVRTSTVENASVHWTVLDVIGSYLRIKKSAVLSWSLPDCFPCIVHFLQSTEAETTDIDEQLSEAALRLVHPTYSVILNLFQSPHIPNHNLLHRADLRSTNEEEVEARIVVQESTTDWLPPLSASLDPTFYVHDLSDAEIGELDQPLEVPRGPLPWQNLEAHATASTELLFSFIDQLAGTLVTAPQKIQPPLLNHIQSLITAVKQSDFGVDTAAFCVSALLLPMVQKWLRRDNCQDDGRNLKQAIGTCTQIVLDLMDGVEQSPWSTRLQSDIGRLTVECCAEPGDISRVGAACIRHVSTIASKFNTPQWTIFEKTVWDGCVVTLHPIRLLISQFICGNDEGGKLRTDGTGPLPPKIRIMAQQVFLVDSQRGRTENGQVEDEECGDIDLVFEENGLRVRIPVSLVISSLLAHQLILQLIGNLLAPIIVADSMKRILGQGPDEQLLDKMSKRTVARLLYCLDASFQTAVDTDSRPGVSLLISKTTGMADPNLFKQLVSSGLIKFHSLFQLWKLTGDEDSMTRLCHSLERVISELQRLEKKAAMERMAVLQREYKEQSFEFMLVEENGEKLYKIVTQKDIDTTLAEYQRQKPLGTQPNKGRKNPFTESLSHEMTVSDQTETDGNTLRLVAYRDLCLTLINLALSEPNPSQVFRPLLPAAKKLLRASPDLSIRTLAVQLLDLYAKTWPFASRVGGQPSRH